MNTDDKKHLILSYLQHGGTYTAAELARTMHDDGVLSSMDRQEVQPRLHDLVNSGDVAALGKRPCRVSKRQATEYQATWFMEGGER